MDIKTFHKYIPDGKTNEQIVGELYQFISCPKGHTVDFYGYYSDYDWVLFCSLFGTMMDLPKGFPMYCKDLKQMLDDKAESLTNEGFVGIPSFENKINFLKAAVNYPKQNNEHNALADAEWNMQLHKFLKTF